MTPRALILRAPGLNRDEDAATAIGLAGGAPTLLHVNRLVESPALLDDYGILIVPGGFSYGDHLGAGRLLAIDLADRLADAIARFVDRGRAVIGICNGFQALVKAGILPGGAPATLTDNASRRFECRWVTLEAPPGASQLTRGLTRRMQVPVAHGEGQFIASDADALLRAGQVALRYVREDGGQASYPANPNGSAGDIAGVCNAQGNVLGLMPHPENAIFAQQHPRWTREPPRAEGDGLALFRNAVRYAQSL